jgi:hypothetical protein
MRKVEMIGAGMSFGDIPAFDPSAERWGTNNVMFARYGGDFDHWTRWFDLHPTPHIQARRAQAYDWYTRQDERRPIYRWERDSAIVGSVAYPKDAVLSFFSGKGHQERDFWGSIAWMIALAIYEGFDAIDLFWFTLMNDHMNAYEKQVPSTRYWIGQARGRGINVRIHGDSALKPMHPLYGCEILAPSLT